MGDLWKYFTRYDSAYPSYHGSYQYSDNVTAETAILDLLRKEIKLNLHGRHELVIIFYNKEHNYFKFPRVFLQLFRRKEFKLL